MTKPTDDFDAQKATATLKHENEGVNFENKVKEAIRRSVDVQTEIKGVVWCLLKEKIVWLVLGAFSFVGLGLLKELGNKLIGMIK